MVGCLWLPVTQLYCIWPPLLASEGTALISTWPIHTHTHTRARTHTLKSPVQYAFIYFSQCTPSHHHCLTLEPLSFLCSSLQEFIHCSSAPGETYILWVCSFLGPLSSSQWGKLLNLSGVSFGGTRLFSVDSVSLGQQPSPSGFFALLANLTLG